MDIGGETGPNETAVVPPPADERVTELERTLESLREDSEIAHVLLGLSGVLAEVRTVGETLEVATRVIPDLLGTKRCFAASWSRGKGNFAIEAHSGYTEEEIRSLNECARTDGGLPFLSAAIEQRTPLLVPDASTDPRITPREAKARRLGSYIAIPLIRWGEQFGGLGIEFDEPREFASKDLALARGIARQVGVALVNARRFNLLGSLRQSGLKIASRLRLSEVLADVGTSAADLLSGESGSVYLVDASRESLVAAAGSFSTDPVPEDLRRIDLRADPWSNLLQGRAVLVRSVQSSDGELSAVAAPLTGEGVVLGAIVVFFEKAANLAPDETEALSVFATQAALAIENANRFERQRRVARSLQEGLLLSELPDVENFDIAAVYDPASGEADVGGDFYDVFDLPDGRYAVVVGDVSGKGAEAAAQTAMAKYMLRAFAIRNPMPSSVLFHLNNALVRDMEDERFSTLFYAVLDPGAMLVSFGLAGHPPPLLYRKEDETVESIEAQGSILGVFPDEQYQQETVPLARGDVLVAFTDGLIEARKDGDFYGRRRAEESLQANAGTSSELLSKVLLEDAKDFGPLSDDTVVFVLQTR